MELRPSVADSADRLAKERRVNHTTVVLSSFLKLLRVKSKNARRQLQEQF